MDAIRPVAEPEVARCAHCGFRAHSNLPRPQQRPMIAVIDEIGRSLVCALCLIVVLSSATLAADVTVFVARPAPVRATREQRQDAVRLEVEPCEMHAGGTITYRVFLDGRWVGWVGDGRPWRGWGYGGRRWWACWRQDGDTAARWSTDLDYRTRTAALAGLVEQTAAPR